MTNMFKKINFRDGITLDGLPYDEFLKAHICDIIELGYSYGLKLEQFSVDSEMIYFDWSGAKGSVLEWFKRCSVNEPEERRIATIRIILNK